MTTNYERIKQMSIDEMSNCLDCDCCIYNAECDSYNNVTTCADGIKQWLESEAEDE